MHEPSRPSWDSPTSHAVHVRFAPSAGHASRPIDWEEEPLTLRRDDGTLDVIGQSGDLVGLLRWVLSYGVYAEVLAPNILREWVATTAWRVARLYEGDPDGYRRDGQSGLYLLD